MLQVIYASAAARPFSSDDLKTLLASARARNTLHRVSGMLVYHQGSFLQVLEGPDQAVETILTSILKDPRHTRSRILVRGPIVDREFDSWSMGFTDSSNSVLQPPGHVDYARALPRMTQAGSTAKRFLRFFQDGLYHQTA